MKKNVAGQVIGAQMVSASDGSAFTGAVTVYVTGDGGTQAAGSVGSGACTHEGNGFHSYAPAQAETNYDHVAFTFTGTGAIPATVQVYPSFPQTGDSFARLGAPAGASVSADVAAAKTQIDAIKASTDNLPSDPADESSIQSTLVTIAGYIDSEVSAIKAKTDQLTFTTANQVDATTVTNGDKSGYSLTSDFRIKKNTALANFMFVMLDSADHVTPKTGLTITAERSLDGGAFGACGNAAAEISAGVYKIDLDAADLNADVVTLKFTASGADPRLLTIVTQTE